MAGDDLVHSQKEIDERIAKNDPEGKRFKRAELEEKQRKLWDAFVKWRDEIDISCAESVWQVDEVILQAPALIETLCDIAGYTPQREGQ